MRRESGPGDAIEEISMSGKACSVFANYDIPS